MANSSLRQRYQIRTGYEGWIPTTLKEKHELRKMNQILISEATDKDIESEIEYVMKTMKEKSAGFEALPVLQKAYQGFLVKLNEIRADSSTEDVRIPLVGKFITKIKQSGNSVINAIKGYWVQIGEIEEFSLNLVTFFEDIENFLNSVNIPDDKKDTKLSEIIKNLGKSAKTESFYVLKNLNLILEKKNTKLAAARMEKKRNRRDRRRAASEDPKEKTSEAEEENPAEKKNEFSFDSEIKKALSGFEKTEGSVDSLDNLSFYTENIIERLSNSLIGFYESAKSAGVSDLSELDDKVLEKIINDIERIHEYAKEEDVVDKLEPILKFVVAKSRQFEPVNKKSLAKEFVQKIGNEGKTNLFSFEDSVEKKASNLFVKGVFEQSQQKQLSKEILNLTFNQLSEVVKKLKGITADVSAKIKNSADRVEPIAKALGADGDGEGDKKKSEDAPEGTEKKGDPSKAGGDEGEKTKPGDSPAGDAGKSGDPGKAGGAPDGGSPSSSPAAGGDKSSKVIPIYKKALEKEKYRVEDMDEDEILELGQKLWKKKFGKGGIQILKFLINQGLINK